MPASFFTDDDLIRRAEDHSLPASGDALWQELTSGGTPVVDKQTNRWTFLWRTPPGLDTPEAVHLALNRITDKDQQARGMMLPIPGTDIWARTLILPPTLRASYCFNPVAAGGQVRKGPPAHNTYAGFLDTTATTAPMVRGDQPGRGLSLLRGPGAPADPLWETHRQGTPDAPPHRNYTVADLDFPDTAAAHPDAELTRGAYLYLPADTAACGLLTIFDAHVWFDRLHLPDILAAATADGVLPPLAVLGLANNSVPDRKATLGANPVFVREVAGRATDWARAQAKAAGVALSGPRILAGQSLGGLTALLAARELPQAWDHIIAQSPSLWWVPGENRFPAHLGERTIDWITGELAAAAAGAGSAEASGVRLPPIHLDVGLQEKLSVARMHMLAQVLDTPLHLYDGGHDYAWWRCALTTRLRAILSPESLPDVGPALTDLPTTAKGSAQ